MKNYKSVKRKINIKELESVICDVCGKEYIDEFEIQEFYYIRHSTGWGSIIGDELEIELDICQHCFDKLFKGKYRVDSNDIL